MLYHWYELELGEAASDTHGSPPLPRLAFSDVSARAEAFGARFEISETAVLKADNDFEPDAISARLRETGLGILGDPAHRIHVDHYALADRWRRNMHLLAIAANDFALSLLERFQQICRGPIAPRSHTIVSNGSKDAALDRDGARRQRHFGRERKSAN